MSHFTVLVIGDDVEGQLAPYHEFECTGDDNQYIQTIDKTEEALAGFAKNKTTRYKTPTGLQSIYDSEGNYRKDLLRDPVEGEKEPGVFEPRDGNRWSNGKILAIPGNWEEVEIPTSEVETAAEWIEGWYGHAIVSFGEEPDLEGKHKYGYTIVDEAGNVLKTYDRTNPEAHWDWYQIGGRWNGFFKVKPVAIGATTLGEPGIQTMDEDYEPPKGDRADQLLKGMIDLEGMRDEAGETAAAKFDKFTALTVGCAPAISWEAVRETMYPGDIEAARTFYNAQEMVQALKKSDDREVIWWNVEEFSVGREKYIQDARDGAISTFAVVKDGKWYERGDMGWWGCVADEKDKDTWRQEFTSLIDGLSDDTLMTVVDCHI